MVVFFLSVFGLFFFFFFFSIPFCLEVFAGSAPPSLAVCVGQRQQDHCYFYGDGSLTLEGGMGSAAGSWPCRSPRQTHVSFALGTGVYEKKEKGKKGNNNPVNFSFIRCSAFKYYLHPDGKCFSFICVYFPGRVLFLCFCMNFRH